jgi:hypothetical protein
MMRHIVSCVHYKRTTNSSEWKRIGRRRKRKKRKQAKLRKEREKDNNEAKRKRKTQKETCVFFLSFLLFLV